MTHRKTIYYTANRFVDGYPVHGYVENEGKKIKAFVELRYGYRVKVYPIGVFHVEYRNGNWIATEDYSGMCVISDKKLDSVISKLNDPLVKSTMNNLSDFRQSCHLLIEKVVKESKQ